MSKLQRDKEIISLYMYVHNTVDFSKLDINSKVYPNVDRLKVQIGDKLEAVCPQAFVEAKGFTMAQWKKAKRTVFKVGRSNKIPTASVTSSFMTKFEEWNDGNLPPFSYAEAENIFRENVEDYSREMPLCALTPKKEEDFLCTAWMLRYFKVYGDISPTDYLIKLSITHKNEVN